MAVQKTPEDMGELFEKSLMHPSCTAYANKRTQLLQDEANENWDKDAQDSASDTERKASAIVAKIREDERRNLFGNVPGEAVPGSTTRDMGGQFLVNLPRIEQSKVYGIAKSMPKGCHLHVHFNAELPPELLLVRARALTGTMFIRSLRPLVKAEDFVETEIVFSILPESTASVDIFAEDYQPEWKAAGSRPWMRWADFQGKFPSSITVEDQGRLSASEAWARDKIILTLRDVYGSGQTQQTCNGIWARFNQGTRAFKGLLNCESIYRWYVGESIDRMVKDGIMYCEWRPMLMDKTIPSDDGLRTLDHADQMTIICEESRKKQSQYPGRFLGVKIIYCTPRSIPRAKMQSELLDCIKLAQQFPDLICGFDLVGAEDRPNNIAFYADLLLAFRATCTRLHLDIPFLFHAGESLLDTGGSALPSNSNLYDALLLDARRVSHGYALLKHPLLVAEYKRRGIAVELCPVSNELLHLCGNVKEHQFPQLLAAGLHCTLNSDNPSLFRGAETEGTSLSHEFYQVMVGSPAMSLHGWRQLAEWSIEHSCMTEEEQVLARDIFKKDWDRFCEEVVLDYGEYAATLPELK